MTREGCELAFRAAVRSIMRNGSVNSEKLLEIIQQEKHALETLLPSRLLCKYSQNMDCVEKFVEIAHIERLGILASLAEGSWEENIVWETGILKHDDWFIDQNGHTSTITTFNLDSFMQIGTKGYSELFFRLGVHYFTHYVSKKDFVHYSSDLLEWVPLTLNGKLGWKFIPAGFVGTIKFCEQLTLANLLSQVPREAELNLTKFQTLWLIRLLGLAAFSKSVKRETVFVTACKSY